MPPLEAALAAVDFTAAAFTEDLVEVAGAAADGVVLRSAR
jgi:hypothetical protein